MPRYLLHGLVVETRTDLAADPAPILLGRLPPAPEGVVAEVVISTRAGAVRMDGPELAITARASRERPPHPGPLPRGGRGENHLGERPLDAGPLHQESRGQSLGEQPPHPGPLPRGGRGKNSLVASGEMGSIYVTAPGVEITVEGEHLDAVLAPSVASEGAYGFAQVPLLAALLVALRPRGLYHLHAAALVAPDGRALLVAGDAGSGKSTLGAALVVAGCDYLGDDVVLVARTERGPELVAFPRDFHFSPRSAEAIPGAAARLDARRTLSGKHRVDPRDLFPGRERDRATAPAALLFPAVAKLPRTLLAPLPAADALGQLLESSALLTAPSLPGVQEHLRALGDVADGAHAFGAALGQDLLEDAAGTGARVLAEALA